MEQIAIRVKFFGVNKSTIYSGTLNEWKEYFENKNLNKDLMINAAYAHFGRVQKITIAKKFNKFINIKDELELKEVA